MAGFRTSKKLTADVCEAVYSAPSNASASVSVSVLAPTGCTVFVQSTDLDPLALSAAQTFTVPPSGLWQESFPDVFDDLRGSEGKNNVAFQLIQRQHYDADNSSDGFAWNTSKPYTWGFSRAAATDVVSSDLEQAEIMWNGATNAITIDRGTTTNGSSSRGAWRLNHDPIDFRYLPHEVAVGLYHVTGTNPRLFWYEEGYTSDSSTNANYGYIGTNRHPDYSSGSYQTSTGAPWLYSSSSSYYNNYTGTAFYIEADDEIRGITMGTNRYISSMYQTASSVSDNYGWSQNRTTSSNWVYSGLSGYTLTKKFACDLCPTGSSYATRGIKLYVTGYSSTTCKIIMIDALHTNNWSNSNWVSNHEAATITMPSSTHRPVWMINSNGYYYVAFQKDNNDNRKESASDQALYKIAEADFTTGTWSAVTVPAYVDLLPRPIIYADGKMAFAKWSDTANDQMTNGGGSVYYDRDLWDDVGLAGLEAGSTDTFTENLQDFTLDTYSSAPNSVVTQLFSDNSFTPTSQRSITDSNVLYGLAFHTSDTSFRTVSSNFANRDDASDITETMSQSFERTNLIVGAGETVFAHDTKDGSIVHVYGYEDR